MELGKNEEIIEKAVFDKQAIIRYYWSSLLLLCIPIITIPIVILIAIIYMIVLDRVVSNWECTLTTRALHVKKGVLNKLEKTVPLEKITDLQMRQGFVMRFFDLRNIAVETAGQSGPGSLISLLGIKDTERFRRDVLDQRDRMGERSAPAVGDAHASSSSQPSEDMVEIRNSLKRTNELLEELVKQGRS
jgi:putative membrane protein